MKKRKGKKLPKISITFWGYLAPELKSVFFKEYKVLTMMGTTNIRNHDFEWRDYPTGVFG